MLGAGLAVLTIGSSNAYAGELEVRTQRVSFADLNVQSPAGRKTLELRVLAAAKQVCGYQDYGAMSLYRPAVTQCYRETRRTALAEVEIIAASRSARKDVRLTGVTANSQGL